MCWQHCIINSSCATARCAACWRGDATEEVDMKTHRILGPTLLAVSGLLMAAPLAVGPATKGTLTATFKQEGASVENPFLKWSGQVDYDPANVAASSAQIEVDMGSYDIGDPLYSAEL